MEPVRTGLRRSCKTCCDTRPAERAVTLAWPMYAAKKWPHAHEHKLMDGS